MPPRSNLFQRVIFVVQQHLVDGSTVTESAMLLDSSTGERREVDILIEGKILGVPVPINVAVECRDHKSAQDVTWIEQADSKRQHLPIAVLILASSSGFTKQARKKASHLKIVLWEPTTLDEDASREIVGKLSSLWAKRFSYEPSDMTLRPTLETLKGEPLDDASVPKDLAPELVDVDGNPLGNIHDFVGQGVASQQGNEYMRDAQAGTHQIRINIPDFQLTRVSDGAQIKVYTHPVGHPDQRYRLRSLTGGVPAKIVVTEVPLEHRQLEGTPYSYGHDGEGMMLVITEAKGQPPHVSLSSYAAPKTRRPAPEP